MNFGGTFFNMICLFIFARSLNPDNICLTTVYSSELPIELFIFISRLSIILYSASKYLISVTGFKKQLANLRLPIGVIHSFNILTTDEYLPLYVSSSIIFSCFNE